MILLALVLVSTHSPSPLPHFSISLDSVVAIFAPRDSRKLTATVSVVRMIDFKQVDRQYVKGETSTHHSVTHMDVLKTMSFITSTFTWPCSDPLKRQTFTPPCHTTPGVCWRLVEQTLPLLLLYATRYENRWTKKTFWTEHNEITALNPKS